MKYLLLCCFDEQRWLGIPPAQRDAIMQEYGAWIRRTSESGHHCASAKLAPSADATTVRETNGKPSFTDGPFAETKEQLGGYHLVECADRDEAVGLALGIPTLKVGGTVEVRALESES